MSLKEIMFTPDLINEIKKTFNFWLESGVKYSMPQYSKENCQKAESIIFNLVSELERIGHDAKEIEKLKVFESSVLAMNNLNGQVPGLIETGERESLCDLYDNIGKEIGLAPEKFGSDGIASEWRDW